jgi:peroxiredoxin
VKTRLPIGCWLATLLVFAALGISATAEAGKFNRVLSAGDAAPAWGRLDDLEGNPVELSGLQDAKCIVVLFLANHCPVATAYERKLIRLQDVYRERGVEFVAISVSLKAGSTREGMRVRAAEQGFNFPYLHDATQSAGKAYGVVATPTAFVLDGERKVVYLGAIDDSWQAPEKVEEDYLPAAIDAVLAGKRPEIRESRPVGCEIEYRETGKSS